MDDFNATVKAALGDELVTITLEDATETYTVSKALLCDASDYFKKALNGNFQEAGTRTLCLPGCDDQTFRYFMFYLVKKTLPSCEALRNQNDDGGVSMARLWIFGDYLTPKLLQLQDLAMMRILEIMGGTVEVDLVEMVLANAPEECVLRTAVLQELVYDINSVRNLYDVDDMDRLGAIPGFFYAFRCLASSQRSHRVNKGKDFVAPSNRSDVSEYMVSKSAGDE